MTHFRSNRTQNYSLQYSYCSESNSLFIGTRKDETFDIKFSIWYKVNLFLWLLRCKIITGTEQLGSQIVRRLFGLQCENRCMVHILEAYLVPFAGHVVCQSMTKKQVAGKKGRTQSKAAEGCIPTQSLGCSVEVKTEPPFALSSVKRAQGSRRLHHCREGSQAR